MLTPVCHLFNLFLSPQSGVSGVRGRRPDEVPTAARVCLTDVDTSGLCEAAAHSQLCSVCSFSGLGLLVYNYISNESLSEAAVSTRLHSRAQLMEAGLQLAVRNVRLVGEKLSRIDISVLPALMTHPA